MSNRDLREPVEMVEAGKGRNIYREERSGYSEEEVHGPV